MVVSQKSQYALRAIFELAKHHGQGPIKNAAIAQAQAIPPRFLEVILNQLKQTGILESKRGSDGGYYLVRLPRKLTIGQVLKIMQGPFEPVECVSKGTANKCPLYGDCVFLPLWENVREVVSEVYDNKTFQDLMDYEKQKNKKYVPSYSI